MKHLKHASKIFAKTPEKTLKTVQLEKHKQHLDKTLANISVKHMQHPAKHTCNIRLKKTDETLGTKVCNIRVQPLKYMQHLDLLFQHPYETLATYL